MLFLGTQWRYCHHGAHSLQSSNVGSIICGDRRQGIGQKTYCSAGCARQLRLYHIQRLAKSALRNECQHNIFVKPTTHKSMLSEGYNSARSDGRLVKGPWTASWLTLVIESQGCSCRCTQQRSCRRGAPSRLDHTLLRKLEDAHIAGELIHLQQMPNTRQQQSQFDGFG